MNCKKNPITPTINFSISSEKYENVNDPIKIPIPANGTINLRVS